MNEFNAIVGQSGGPTSAINATLAGVIRGAAEAHAGGQMGRLYGMRYGIEGLLEEELVDLTPHFGDEAWLQTLAMTPAAVLGSCRRRLKPCTEDSATYERLLALFRKYSIHYFFYIGGNDSMDTVGKLSEYAAKQDYPLWVIGVPKTIDNDLMGTDHTPGFGSAAKYVATTVKEILRDVSVYTVPAVTVVEIMGRDAGWLTAAAALPLCSGGRGPDLIYLPEHPFDTDRFLEDVRAAQRRHPAVLVAVSEGVRLVSGEYVAAATQSGAVDVFGHRYLSGAGKTLEHLIREHIGCKVRSLELSLPQRCAAHVASATDLAESVEVGRRAVAAALAGHSGVMMTILRRADGQGDYQAAYGEADIATVANAIRHVPSSYLNAEGNGISEEGLRYLLPLIQGEVAPRYENGLPAHVVI